MEARGKFGSDSPTARKQGGSGRGALAALQKLVAAALASSSYQRSGLETGQRRLVLRRWWLEQAGA